MELTQSDNGQIVFLYKVGSGISPSSYALETSKAAGFSAKTRGRVEEIVDSIQNNKPIQPLKGLQTANFGDL